MTTLTRDEMTASVRKSFDDLGEQAVQTMVAIGFAESGGHVEAVNDNYPTYQSADSIFRYDYGPGQVNSVWTSPYGPFDATKLTSDPDYNFSACRYIYDRQGFGAWSTYNGGQWRDHFQMPTAPTAPEPHQDTALEIKLWNALVAIRDIANEALKE